MAGESLTFGESRPKPSALNAVTHVGLQEIIMHPFGEGALTSTGVQYSTPSTNATAAVNTIAAVGSAQPPVLGDLYELEMGLTAEVKSDSGTGLVTWQWQGRNLNKGAAWVNLHAADSSVFAATAYVPDTKSGRFNLQNNLDKIPFEIQLLIQSNKASDGAARIKNSTYVKVVTSSLYKRALD